MIIFELITSEIGGVLGVDLTCPFCRIEDETALLVLKENNYASHVWIRHVPSKVINNFFSF